MWEKSGSAVTHCSARWQRRSGLIRLARWRLQCRNCVERAGTHLGTPHFALECRARRAVNTSGETFLALCLPQSNPDQHKLAIERCSWRQPVLQEPVATDAGGNVEYPNAVQVLHDAAKAPHTCPLLHLVVGRQSLEAEATVFWQRP